jgi:hypothetical protein
LDILLFRRHGIDGKSYHCYVLKCHVMDVLLYNIQHDRYCKDVQLDHNSEIAEAVLTFALHFIETNRPCIDVLQRNQHVNPPANTLSH